MTWGGALAATVATTVNLTNPPVSLIAAIGDSITAAAVEADTTKTYYSNRGFLSWAQILSMGRIWCPLVATAGAAPSINYNRAVSGMTTVHGLETQLPEVLALNPRPQFCSVLMGTNDLALLPNDSAATIFGRITLICQRLLEAGIRPVLLTLLPRGDSASGATGWSPLTAGAPVTAAKQRLLAVNRMIKQAATLVDNRIVVVDSWDRLADYATGGVLASMSSDYIHPYPINGAFEIGQAFATAISAVLRPVVTPAQSDDDVSPVLFSSAWGATGGTAGTGFTGTVPAGWTANRQSGSSGTATVALTNRQLVITATGANDAALFRAYKGTGSFPSVADPAGTGVYMQADVDFTPTVAGGRCELWFRDTGPGHQCNALGGDNTAGIPKAFVGRLRTPVLLAPAGGINWQGWLQDRTNGVSQHTSKWSNVMAGRYVSLADVGAL